LKSAIQRGITSSITRDRVAAEKSKEQLKEKFCDVNRPMLDSIISELR